MSNEPAIDAISPFWRGWASFVLRFRLPLLLLTIALAVAAAYTVRTRLKIETSLESLAPRNTAVARSLEAFRDAFGRDDVFVIVAQGEVLSLDYLQRLTRLHRDLEALDVAIGARAKAARAAPAPTTPGGPAAPPALAPMTDSAAAAAATATGAGAAGGEGDLVGDEDLSGDKDFGGDEDFGGDDDFGGDAAFAAGGEAADAWEGVVGGSVVDEVVSLVNARRTHMEDGALHIGELLDPFPSAEGLAELGEQIRGSRLLMGQIVGPKLQHSAVLVRTHLMPEADSERVHDAVRGLLERHDAAAFKLTLAGLPAMMVTMKTRMFGDLRVLVGLALGVMVLVLAFLFRHPLGVVAPLVVVVMSLMWTFAFMATVGFPMTLMSNIMPSFLICVGLGAAIHIVSVYRDELLAGHAGREAVIRAVATTGRPVFFTSLTTMVGLLSFKFASVEPLAEMGMAGAFGIASAFLHSVVFLPIALSFNRGSLMGRGHGQDGDRLDRFLALCNGLSSGATPADARRRRATTLAVGAVLTVVAALGMSRLVVAHDPVSWLPDSEPLRVAFATIDREIGGTANIQLLIDTEGPHGIADIHLLRGLEALEDHIHAYRDPKGRGAVVGHSMSLLDVVKETNQALHGGDPAWYRLPETQRGASDLLFMFESAGAEQMRRLATTDMKRTQMTVRVKWLDATAYVPLAEHVDRGVTEHLSGVAKVRTTGASYTMLSVVTRVIGDVLRSFGAAFALITLFMILLLADLRLGLIAMAPNLMPILFIAGIMGHGGVPIDMVNLMIASIAIGVAVDDTIHFLYHFRVVHRAGGTVDDAIAAAMQHCGRAIVSTSVVLALGFSVYLAASMSSLQRFGGLIALTAVMALLIDLIFAPALLRLVYARRDPARRS